MCHITGSNYDEVCLLLASILRRGRSGNHARNHVWLHVYSTCPLLQMYPVADMHGPCKQSYRVVPIVEVIQTFLNISSV